MVCLWAAFVGMPWWVQRTCITPRWVDGEEGAGVGWERGRERPGAGEGGLLLVRAGGFVCSVPSVYTKTP